MLCKNVSYDLIIFELIIHKSHLKYKVDNLCAELRFIHIHQHSARQTRNVTDMT